MAQRDAPPDSSKVRALPPRPAQRQHHASTLPKLQAPMWLLDATRPRVVMMDANILVDLAESCIGEKAARSAVLEQLHTQHLRIIVSHRDVEQVDARLPPYRSIERVERSMENKAKLNVARAAAMQEAWQTHLRPWVHVLDPAGIPPTPLQRDVMSRDPDDADLALLADLIGADAFMSRDEEAFGPTRFPVLPSVQRPKGAGSSPTEVIPGVLEILASWRNERRVRQHTSHLMFPPTVTVLGLGEGVKAISRQLQVHPAVVVAGGALLGIAGALLLPPKTKEGIGKAFKVYGKHIADIQQTLPERDYAEHLADLCELPEWPEATDFKRQAARHLAHAQQPVHIEALAQLRGIKVQTARAHLRKHPGLFQEWQGGEWSLAGRQKDFQGEEVRSSDL